ncbi:HupE/UreJ family protein [Akkermansiaceae bacterium]|nr:HupE/UreJ family protein [Akkermansiaceae bacterium]MDB4537394.1 HupE/UreJ family protein [Akkermansiaceae bacterium]
MFRRSIAVWIAAAGAFLAMTGAALAHAVPDIPVRGYFNKGGSATIKVEIDIRCFAEEPVDEPYLQKWVLAESTEAEKKEYIDQARKLINDSVVFRFEPTGTFSPEFKFTFTTHGGKPLTKADDPVMVTGEWKTTITKETRGYRISATAGKTLSVQFLNHFDGQAMERFAVLFPGEDSFILDLSGHTLGSGNSQTSVDESQWVGPEATVGDRWATLTNMLRQGFVHVLPLGLDHIFFVLGLFFLSRKWRPLLYQVSMFTVAHTITLFLSTVGLVSVSSAIVEPIIAGSIAYVAIENLCRRQYSHWRLLVVFFFGLIHGLGFAGALANLNLPPASLIVGLLGFNAGVELGQLAVITLALGATFWIKDPKQYRKFVVVPGSILIALLGIFWMVQRITGA